MDLLWLAYFSAFGGVLGMLPLAWLGRRWLDAGSTPAHASRVAGRVHKLVVPLLITAVTGAVVAGRAVPIWRLPVPPVVGLVLAFLSLTFFSLATLNLVLKGAGSPILLAFTQRLASSGLYKRTRNPIILGGFLLLFSLGLWMQSLFLVLWSAGLFLPVVVVFLKIYEERELEIRFGDGYRAYRARTPMLFPRLH